MLQNKEISYHNTKPSQAKPHIEKQMVRSQIKKSQPMTFNGQKKKQKQKTLRKKSVSDLSLRDFLKFH